MVREGLKMLLERAGFKVVGEASDGQEAVRRVRDLVPDVAVLDLAMPLLNGLEAAREILRDSPRTRPILLTMHTEDPYVTAALRVGVKAYVLKTQSGPDLVQAIQEVCRGRIYLSPGISRTVVEAYLAKTELPPDPLSRCRMISAGAMIDVDIREAPQKPGLGGERQLREVDRPFLQLLVQNEKLVNALYEAREQISSLKEEVDKLCAPPSTYGVYLSVNEDATVNILSQGRKVKVNLHPSIKAETLKPGQELVLNEGLNVVEAAGYEIQGDVVILKEQLDEERAVVTLRADEEKVGIIADPLRKLRLKIGDHLLMDAKSGYLLEKLPKSEVEDLALEEVPDINYEDIGGLTTQIEAIKDAVELPYLYADYYREHQLTPPKGVLLYGPPGCGDRKSTRLNSSHLVISYAVFCLKK